MNVFVCVKKIGKRVQELKPCGFELPGTPRSLRELIGMMVRVNVQRYNANLCSTDPIPLPSAADMDDMAVTGKIAFGIPFGTREADPKEAMETAIAGFQDGLYRIFINDTEAEQLDTFLELKERDTITIIRLVMLTGGFF